MNDRTRTRRTDALRRYPALGFLGVAAILAMWLPTALRVPLSSPSSQAEVAPVPGHSNAAADVSDLNGASSGGLGSGFGKGNAVGAGQDAVTPVTQPKRKGTKVKSCVGKPPQQTEDPLSPSCVPFFEGDNGGATARGVTGTEITVVVYTPSASSTGDPSWVDWDKQNDATGKNTDSVGYAFSQYFNERYQTYGRHVHFWRYRGTPPPSGGITPELLRKDVGDIDAQRHPFAIVTMLTEGANVAASEAARRGIVAFNHEAFDRSAYTEFGGKLISWVPDLQDEAAQAANYACTKLKGRPARFSSEYALSPRKFGIFYEKSNKNAEARILADLTKKSFADCGIPIDTVVSAGSDTTQQAATEYTTAMAQLINDNITTVVVIAGGGATNNMSNRAAASGYFPEWFIPGSGTDDAGADRDTAAQLANQSEWRAAFGISYDTRRDAVARQPWHNAYVEGCPTCFDTLVSDAPRLYDTEMLAMIGIQAAGPKLTAANLDRGLVALPGHRSSNPYAPAAYFTPGNWSFIKDAMEIWWDTSATAPNETRPGCYRLTNNGQRFRAGDWTGDDSQLFTGTPPCQAYQHETG